MGPDYLRALRIPLLRGRGFDAGIDLARPLHVPTPDDVPLQVSVEVGRSKIRLRDLLNMGEGYVIELDKLAGEPLDLYVNSKLIAKGEAVMVGDKFGIRLTDVISASDRIEKLG